MIGYDRGPTGIEGPITKLVLGHEQQVNNSTSNIHSDNMSTHTNWHSVCVGNFAAKTSNIITHEVPPCMGCQYATNIFSLLCCAWPASRWTRSFHSVIGFWDSHMPNIIVQIKKKHRNVSVMQILFINCVGNLLTWNWYCFLTLLDIIRTQYIHNYVKLHERDKEDFLVSNGPSFRREYPCIGRSTWSSGDPSQPYHHSSVSLISF